MYTPCHRGIHQTVAIRSLITGHCWNYCTPFKCQTWHLSDWFILSPHFHRLPSLRNDSHIRCHVKHLTLLSQHLIFALQADIYHRPAETELRWFGFTTGFHVLKGLQQSLNFILLQQERGKYSFATSWPGEFTWWKEKGVGSCGSKDQEEVFSLGHSLQLIPIPCAYNCFAGGVGVLLVSFCCFVPFMTHGVQRPEIFKWNKHIRALPMILTHQCYLQASYFGGRQGKWY